MFRSLRNRNYRFYFAGSAVSNVGTWLQRIAQDWLVLEVLHGGGVALGITTGLQFLPFLLVTPVAGLLADRFPKRRVIQCAQAGMGLASGLLGVLAVTGTVEIWHVYLLALSFGVANAVDGPARQSFAMEIVGRDDLPNAVGLNSASFNAARMFGPALAGGTIALLGGGMWGTGWVILLNAVSYIGPMCAIALMRADELKPAAPQERRPGLLREGLAYVRSRHDLMLVLVIVLFVGCFGMNFQITSALMATEIYGKGAGGFGILSSAVAIGSLVGALIAARRKQPRQRLIVLAAVAFGVIEIAAALMPTYYAFMAVLPFLGLATLTLLTAANAMMQMTVPEHMRGRVMALYMMVHIGTTPIGAPIVGWIGEAFGARWSLIVGGGVSLLGTLVAVLVLSRRQGMVVRAHLSPRPHVHVWRMPEPAAPATVAPEAAAAVPAAVRIGQPLPSEVSVEASAEASGRSRRPADTTGVRPLPRATGSSWTSPVTNRCARTAPAGAAGSTGSRYGRASARPARMRSPQSTTS